MKDEKIDPEGHLLIDLGLEEGTPEPQEVKVAHISDPESFDVGFSSSIPDAFLLYFHPPEGSTQETRALAFKGEAAGKLLAVFHQLLLTFGLVSEQEETSSQVPKKKITLH